MAVKITTRARVTAEAPAKKAVVKKPVPKQSAPAKKTATRAPATKTAVRATASRTGRNSSAPVVKDTPVPRRTRAAKQEPEFATLQERRDSTDPRKRIGGLSYKQLSELSGYGLGSEQFITAVEIMKGAGTRQEVNHRVAALLPATTRNGTPKTVSNLVSGVIHNLEQRGFTIVGSWKMVAPKA